MLVGYGNEDMSKIDKDDILKALKHGYMIPIEMTKITNFNEKHPEFHNVYIPRITERYGMMYKNELWELMDKDELADIIHDNKKAYVEDNFEELIKSLNPSQISTLNKWLQTHENDKSIMNTKKEIKNLLYIRRKMAITTKNKIEKQEKGNLKKIK